MCLIATAGGLWKQEKNTEMSCFSWSPEVQMLVHKECDQDTLEKASNRTSCIQMMPREQSFSILYSKLFWQAFLYSHKTESVSFAYLTRSLCPQLFLTCFWAGDTTYTLWICSEISTSRPNSSHQYWYI